MIRTGERETSAAIGLFSLAPCFLVILHRSSQQSGAGAVFNALLCAFLGFVACIPASRYLKIFDGRSIISYIDRGWGRAIGVIISLLVFAYTAYSFNGYEGAVSAPESGFLADDVKRGFLCVVAAVCACAGFEAVTRQGYMIMIVTVALSLIILVTVSAGINTTNLYPILGNTAMQTMFNMDGTAVYSGIFVLPFLCNLIGDGEKSRRCLFRAYTLVALITVFFVLLYALVVPYPLGLLFDFAPDALFASASSGNILHRFEPFFITLMTVVELITAGFGICTASSILSVASSFGDNRPFALAYTLLLYYSGDILSSPAGYYAVCACFLFAGLAIPIVFLLFRKRILKN